MTTLRGLCLAACLWLTGCASDPVPANRNDPLAAQVAEDHWRYDASLASWHLQARMSDGGLVYGPPGVETSPLFGPAVLSETLNRPATAALTDVAQEYVRRTNGSVVRVLRNSPDDLCFEGRYVAEMQDYAAANKFRSVVRLARKPGTNAVRVLTYTQCESDFSGQDVPKWADVLARQTLKD
ncbi:MAG: hypothetical protein QM770_16960 [Tepidisphaeraceae bacterium]